MTPQASSTSQPNGNAVDTISTTTTQTSIKNKMLTCDYLVVGAGTGK